MPEVTFTASDGSSRVVEGVVGDSVMVTAKQHGVPEIVGECGGSLSCATCHVFVDEDQLNELPPVTEQEDEMLWGTAVDREPNSRLSCQLHLTDGAHLRVTTPDRQL